eukprot:9164820-Alexandrium_andersonii.AAC.1
MDLCDQKGLYKCSLGMKKTNKHRPLLRARMQLPPEDSATEQGVAEEGCKANAEGFEGDGDEDVAMSSSSPPEVEFSF